MMQQAIAEHDCHIIYGFIHALLACQQPALVSLPVYCSTDTMPATSLLYSFNIIPAWRDIFTTTHINTSRGPAAARLAFIRMPDD